MTAGAVETAVTWLFVPGSRPTRFAKAAHAGADVVIIDLEDSVAPDDKVSARESVHAAWPVDPDVAVAVRINAHGTKEFGDDVALCRELGPAAVVLPKTENAEDIRLTSEATGRPVLGIVESARGFVNLREICASPGLIRLLFGGIDLALDLSVSDDTALDTSRSDLVRWSAAHRLPSPVDGVTPSITDIGAVSRESLRAKAWGFGGKLCIHPAQLPIVRDAFRPTAEELGWARRVMAAADQADGGAAATGGEMIDRPVVERARRLLECQ